MDFTCRTEVRATDDRNLAWFESLLDARLARADAQVRRQMTIELGDIERLVRWRLAEIDRRLAGIERENDRSRARLLRVEWDQLYWRVDLFLFAFMGLLVVLVLVT